MQRRRAAPGFAAELRLQCGSASRKRRTERQKTPNRVEETGIDERRSAGTGKREIARRTPAKFAEEGRPSTRIGRRVCRNASTNFPIRRSIAGEGNCLRFK